MKHLPATIAIAACAIFALAVPVAHADSFYGSLSVTVWTGNGVSYEASLPAPTGPANFSFTYSGPINFVDNDCQTCSNTFGEFFGSDASFISGLSPSQLSTFLGTTMSTPGEIDNSYLQFIGTYTGGGPVSAEHDDGASLYTGVGYTNTVFNSPDPTTEIPSSGTLPTGTDIPFDLVYVESNGAPSDLIVTGLAPTPEPGTLGLMALGLISLAAVAYRGGGLGS
jgi:PEP-CTERM motif